MDDLKQALNDVKADDRCRRIARGLAKTSYKIAIEYAIGYTRRNLTEKQQVK